MDFLDPIAGIKFQKSSCVPEKFFGGRGYTSCYDYALLQAAQLQKIDGNSLLLM